MTFALVMFHGAAAPRPFDLKKSEIVIGRGEACDLRVPLGSVSRRHCKITLEPSPRVEDMGSSNRTYVNGLRTPAVELEPGDSIQIGPVVFVLQVAGEPAVGDMQPLRAGKHSISVSPIDGSDPDLTPTVETPEV